MSIEAFPILNKESKKELLLELKNNREQIQEDLRTFLDGTNERVLDGICEIIVGNFKVLEKKIEILF